MLENMFGPGSANSNTDLVVQVISRMREETFRAAIEAVTHYEGRDVLPKMNIPVLLVAGEHDLSAAPPAVMEKMASKIPSSEFVCMPGVGHFGWAEDPEVYNKHMLQFLTKNFN
jgi:pimeloyl-ACP methyl ester carboxylesterase